MSWSFSHPQRGGKRITVTLKKQNVWHEVPGECGLVSIAYFVDADGLEWWRYVCWHPFGRWDAYLRNDNNKPHKVVMRRDGFKSEDDAKKFLETMSLLKATA